MSEGSLGRCRTKKCGAESSDPNRHSQPRLPGSVVGEASMRQSLNPAKITKVSVPKLRGAMTINEPRAFRLGGAVRRLAARYFVVTSECVMACTDNAIRFCTPTFLISLATWAFTVRSSIPN